VESNPKPMRRNGRLSNTWTSEMWYDPHVLQSDKNPQTQKAVHGIPNKTALRLASRPKRPGIGCPDQIIRSSSNNSAPRNAASALGSFSLFIARIYAFNSDAGILVDSGQNHNPHPQSPTAQLYIKYNIHCAT